MPRRDVFREMPARISAAYQILYKGTCGFRHDFNWYLIFYRRSTIGWQLRKSPEKLINELISYTLIFLPKILRKYWEDIEKNRKIALLNNKITITINKIINCIKTYSCYILKNLKEYKKKYLYTKHLHEIELVFAHIIYNKICFHKRNIIL